MVRTAVAQVLLFIAVISVSTMAVGVVVTETGLYAQSIGDESERTAAALEAEIAIINDAEANATYNAADRQVTIYVKNIGGSSIEPNDVSVLVNGAYVQPSETRVVGSGGSRSAWRVDSVLELTVDDQSLEAGEHRVVVDVETARDVLVFEVE